MTWRLLARSRGRDFSWREAPFIDPNTLQLCIGTTHVIKLERAKGWTRSVRTTARKFLREGFGPFRLMQAAFTTKKKEFAAWRRGFTAVKHQREVGTG